MARPPGPHQADALGPAGSQIDSYALAVKVGAAALGGDADHEQMARRVLDAAGPLLKELWRLEYEATFVREVDQLRGQLDKLTGSWWEILGRVMADGPCPGASGLLSTDQRLRRGWG